MDHKCEEPLGSLLEVSFRRALAPSQWPLLLIRAPKMAVSHAKHQTSASSKHLANICQFPKNIQEKAGKVWDRREKGQTAFEKAPYSLFSQLSQLRSFSSCFPTQDFRSAGAAVGSGIGSVSSQAEGHISDILSHPSHPSSSESVRPVHPGPQVVSFETQLGQQLPPGAKKISAWRSCLDWKSSCVLCFFPSVLGITR